MENHDKCMETLFKNMPIKISPINTHIHTLTSTHTHYACLLMPITKHTNPGQNTTLRKPGKMPQNKDA